ncbi:MAG: hypothetical protein R3Y47_10530 [Lachnospiraceae bacterium]
MKLEKLGVLALPGDVNFKETSQLCGDIGDQPNQPTRGAHIHINSKMEFQTMQGIGGAFSELGSKALFSLSEGVRDGVAEALFAGKLDYFRLPIGASDFALDAYSLNDEKGDFEMEHFSLARDEERLIPYMELARKFSPEMKLHASPWSPPAWIKDNQYYGNGGSVIDEPRYYKAYAKYFSTYIRAYEEKGFDIDRLNIQNEPDVDPAYPSCMMPAAQMCKFIKEYLHPHFKESGIDTDIFAGTFRTINGASACDFLTADPEISQYIAGIGSQYSVMQPLYNIAMTHPELKLMHTESNCFHGENSWEQAVVLYMSIVNYVNAGCDVFTYWNMILNTVAESTWGWKQNSLVTIDEESGAVTYNPDFHVYSLASSCIKRNSKRVVYTSMNKMGLAFKQEDGSLTCLVSNFSDKQEVGDLTVDGVKLDLTLEPMSIAAYKITP